MCATCGLPATHTGATTILVSSVIPILLVYANVWFFTTKVFFLNRLKSAKVEKVNYISTILLTILSIFVFASPWWLDQLYWLINQAFVYNYLDVYGPRMISAILIGIVFLALNYYYNFVSKNTLIKHLVIILGIELFILSFTLWRDIGLLF